MINWNGSWSLMIKYLKIIYSFFGKYIKIYLFHYLDNKHDDYILYNSRIIIHALEKYRSDEKIVIVLLQLILATAYFKELEKRNLLNQDEHIWAKRIIYGYEFINKDESEKVKIDLDMIDKVIRGRRSVRKYEDFKITHLEINELIKSVLWSPSACNRQPWKFITVYDKDIICMFGDMKERWIKKVPQLIICLANKHAYDDIDIKYTPFIDLGISMQTLMLKAYAMGYDTCLINTGKKEINDKKRTLIRNKLKIGDDWLIVSIITIGKAQKIPKPPGRKPINEVLEFIDKI